MIASDPEIRIRDIAALLKITERATQRIVAELADAGYIDRERQRAPQPLNVKAHMPVGLPTQRDIDIEALLTILQRNDISGRLAPMRDKGNGRTNVRRRSGHSVYGTSSAVTR